MVKYRRLDEICNVNMGQSPWSNSYNEDGDGLPFFQGNADFGELYPNVRIWCNAPTKIVEPETLLISVRAPIGALNFSRERSCIGRGLAGITPKPGVELKYVYYCLKGKNAELNAKGTGSTFKAISKSALGGILVRMIPLTEQQEIVRKLDKLSNVICQRRQQLITFDTLIKARFVEMFGDPVSNPCGYATATLPELGDLGRGVSKHRPRNAPELLGGPYPLIQTGDVANSALYIKNYDSTYSKIGLKQSKMWKAGTLCITIAANIAKTAILTFDACFPDSVVGFNANQNTNNVFVHYWFSFFQELLEIQAPESAQKNINLKILSELRVIVPPIERQNDFAAFVAEVDKSKVDVQKALNNAQTLFDSLMQQYFG